jgi:hypothetical protein
VLTGDGRAILDAADDTFETRLCQILATVTSPEQVVAAAHVLAALRTALERENLGTPIG